MDIARRRQHTWCPRAISECTSLLLLLPRSSSRTSHFVPGSCAVERRLTSMRMFINFRRIRLEYFSSAVLSHIMCSPQQELACFGCVHTNENTPERELPGQSVHITPLHLVCTSVNLTWCGFSHALLLTKSWKTSRLDCMCQNDLVQRDSSQI